MVTTNPFMTYDRESFVNVTPFTRQPDGDEMIIGNVDTAVFVAVPLGAVEVLDYLAAGKSVGEAADLYREHNGEACDIHGLLTVLETKQLVEPSTERTRQTLRTTSRAAVDADKDQVDHFPANAGGVTSPTYHFSGFPEALALRVFSPQLIGSALVLIAISLLVLAQDPSLWPRSDELYYTRQRTLSLIILALISYLGVLIHEFAHLIAARAAGVKCRIGFGHRLYEFVMEADLTLLWSVPKRKRYLPLLAGCLVDAVTAALLILALYANRTGWLAVTDATPFLRMILLSYVARICWQGLVFVRTDVYYVLAALLNCKNLLRDTEDYLRNQLAPIFPGVGIVDQSSIRAKERRVIRFYAVIWIAGRVLALYWLYVVALPLVCRYGADLAKSLATYSRNPAMFWDALVSVLLLVVPGLIGVSLWIRNMRPSDVFSPKRSLLI
jgi:putative peptide zinc metalloprotease protein